ncbi:MAG: hypothetical protein J6S50_05160 [Oscillospiraceae bacterium]|nr:hypothetical protein [Oscillospiraceae bacterium]
MRKAIDLTGQRFGRLTALERAENKNCKATWRCLCDCGNETTVRADSLISGDTQSCGCLHDESLEEVRNKHILKHGGARHNDNTEKLYFTWLNMKKRCENENDPSYKNYGERGITVCDEWHDYAPFRKWAFENGYYFNTNSYEITLDRINVNGNYEPSNCRWVSSKVQNNNRRNNKRITYNGETLTISQWADKLGVNYATLRYRIRCWGVERALH